MAFMAMILARPSSLTLEDMSHMIDVSDQVHRSNRYNARHSKHVECSLLRSKEFGLEGPDEPFGGLRIGSR
jgi:hypothetical protein